ncbi:MarR family transcriptional regulator [Vallitalea pronyensis]|uniref:MarR family transcriptional regulator n=1 Tax=Vallitalea pronyensis TaxID=1348613 RepID=A0A8J8MHB5_9FIRM|nr:MarR family transcriptional regulator [Vallitalea pronyensis]QUI21812.1 MarR family transcriptional regulator [Vallitalea pronyensis]
MNDKIDTNQMIAMFFELVQNIQDLDKKSMYYGLSEPLHNAEIHTLVAIKENEGISITGLAKALGITKGAVSQIVNRLYKKGTVKKDQDPENKSRLTLSLTKDGETAYYYHEKNHEILLNPLIEKLDMLDKTAQQIIYHFLKETNDIFKKGVLEIQ